MAANAACLFVLSVVLPFYDPAKITSGLLKAVVGAILFHKLWVATICGSYVFIYTFVPQWALLLSERRKVRAKILTQIAVELFGEDFHTHRVTLFREINYAHAVVLTIFALVQKKLSSGLPKEDFSLPLPSIPKAKRQLFSELPKPGRYLVVDARCGPYKKSYVMFRVEEDEPERCNSIIAYVRYKRKTLVVQDLPDISDVALKNLKSIDNVPKSRREDVRKYLELGRTQDFAVLQEFNRLARHFFGTIVLQSDGNNPWGVLLIDSLGANAPFSEQAQERLESFARTLGNVGN